MEKPKYLFFFFYKTLQPKLLVCNFMTKELSQS